MTGKALLCCTLITLCSCVHDIYDTLLIDEIPISYQTNVDKGAGELEGSQGTVVFEAGLGDGSASWRLVYDILSPSYQVFAYSRPGYQRSGNVQEADGMRTSDEIAMRLHTLLMQAEIPGPYILVAHSYGSFSCLKFAELYPELVKAIVLVDGRPKEFSRRCKGAGLNPCGPPDYVLSFVPKHVQFEIRGLDKSEAITPDPAQLPDVPITVIAATIPPPGAPKGGGEVWLKTQRDFAGALQNGRYVIAHGAGHYIHKDQPALVSEEIRRLLER